jgi:tripartite-type tricarboxylate transporter receptor subunit TctC
MKHKHIGIIIFATVWTVIFVTGISLCSGQQYPSKQINVMLGYNPGGTLDVVFRPLAKAVERSLGQPLMLTNNGAGGGTVALGIFIKEKPDGYNLDVCHSGLLTMIPHLREATYKIEDFVPVMSFGTPQSGLAVKADSPFKTIKDVVEYARKNPGKFTYFGGAPGAPTQVAMEFIAKQEGVQFSMVPFPGGAPALAALLGGHINASSGSGFVPQVKAGAVRILVMYTEKRVKEFPDVPTLRELGYNFVNDEIFFVSAPKGTPAPIIKALQDNFKQAMQDEAFVQAASRMDVLVAYRSAEEVRKYLTEADGRYGRLIRDLKISLEPEKK